MMMWRLWEVGLKKEKSYVVRFEFAHVYLLYLFTVGVYRRLTLALFLQLK